MKKLFVLEDMSFQKDKNQRGIYWCPNGEEYYNEGQGFVCFLEDKGEYAWGSFEDGYSVRCVEK